MKKINILIAIPSLDSGGVEMAVLDENNQRVSIGWLSGLTDEIKEDFAKNNHLYVDKVCKVQAMDTTEDFKLRHAKFMGFRDDIGIEDCTFNNNMCTGCSPCAGTDVVVRNCLFEGNGRIFYVKGYEFENPWAAMDIEPNPLADKGVKKEGRLVCKEKIKMKR